MAVTSTDYQPFAEQHEGKIAWMYLDTVGKVTVGIGHMIPTADAAAAIPFVDGTGQKASPDAIRAAFAAVQGAQAMVGRVASAFQSLTTLRLDDAGTAAVFAGDFAGIVGRTRTLFQAVGGGLDSYPDPAQLAVIDMAFNLGPDGLYGKFPSFRTKGLAPRAYDVAAQQCRRGGISDERNQWTFDQLMAAAKIEAAGRQA